MERRVGVLIAGLFLAVPCFVTAPPFLRLLLMGIMCVPFAAATALVLTPPIASIRARLAYLCSWCGTHQVNQRARGFDAASLLQLVVATAVLDIAVAAVIVVPDFGRWLPVRWLAGGIMILAFAEMLTACFPLMATAFGLTVPPVMQSPWRSASVSEFWTKRWNLFASEKILRPYFFAPLARRSAALALFAAFAVSGVGHVLLAFIALGRWRISLIWGAFFLVQPLLIVAERRLAVRRWRPTAARAWTLTVLAITSPLFVEPMLQITGLGIQDPALPQTVGALGSVIVLTGMVSLASLASCSTRT
jgi:alginate O-acetyltransferase complex protein AlgI